MVLKHWLMGLLYGYMGEHLILDFVYCYYIAFLFDMASTCVIQSLSLCWLDYVCVYKLQKGRRKENHKLGFFINKFLHKW
jgi:hypothetical protein